MKRSARDGSEECFEQYNEDSLAYEICTMSYLAYGTYSHGVSLPVGYIMMTLQQVYHLNDVVR